MRQLLFDEQTGRQTNGNVERNREKGDRQTEIGRREGDAERNPVTDGYGRVLKSSTSDVYHYMYRLFVFLTWNFLSSRSLECLFGLLLNNHCKAFSHCCIS